MKKKEIIIDGVKYIPESEFFEMDENSILNPVIGKYCIVRTRNEGINCGKVVFADNTGVVVDDVRRIYYHKPKDKNTAWYEGVSVSGLSEDSKISTTVDRKYIIEDYSLTVCTEVAEKSLRNHDAHETTC